MKVTIKTLAGRPWWRLAFWLYQKFFKTKKLAGYTTFWRTIIVQPDRVNDKKLLAHELTHVEQIERMGIVNFTLELLEEHEANGYVGNALELEARKASENPDEVLARFELVYK